MSEYAAVPSTGKLKLKGVRDSRVEKRKKKKPKAVNLSGQDDEDKSVVLRQLEDEDQKIQNEKTSEDRHGAQDIPSCASEVKIGADEEEDGDIRDHLKTEAEKRHEEQRRKRLEKRLEKEGVKTHKQRVEELNKYLSNLSEHHDMPKIGPG